MTSTATDFTAHAAELEAMSLCLDLANSLQLDPELRQEWRELSPVLLVTALAYPDSAQPAAPTVTLARRTFELAAITEYLALATLFHTSAAIPAEWRETTPLVVVQGWVEAMEMAAAAKRG